MTHRRERVFADSATISTDSMSKLFNTTLSPFDVDVRRNVMARRCYDRGWHRRSSAPGAKLGAAIIAAGGRRGLLGMPR